MAVSKIKYRDPDKINLRKAAKNFNRKLDRLAKKLPSEELVYLPRKIYASDIREMEDKIITADRKYYNQMVSRLKRFTKPGAEKLITLPSGTITTVWQKNEIQYQLQSINQSRAARRKKEEQNASGRMGTIYDAEFSPIKNKTNAIKPENFREYAAAVEKSLYTQNEYVSLARYKENYLNSIMKNFGETEFYHAVEKMKAETLFNVTANNPNAEIDFVYDDQTPIEDRIAKIKSEFTRKGVKI